MGQCEIKGQCRNPVVKNAHSQVETARASGYHYFVDYECVILPADAWLKRPYKIRIAYRF